MTAPLTGTVELVQGAAVVTLLGEIDISSAAAVRALLQRALALGTPRVTVDVLGLDFMDAAGVGVLVAVAEELRADGAWLAVRGASPIVRRVLGATGVVQVVGLERPEVSDALLRGVERTLSAANTLKVLDAALRLVVIMAQAVVKGADGVSITLPRQDRLQTVAASNDVVLQMDHDQYDTGQGPCLDAATRGDRFQIEALAKESRWPDFVPRARARGIASILSTPLVAVAKPLGSLNIYSRQTGAFEAHERRWADEFAKEAALVVEASARAVTPALTAQVRSALRSRQAIAMAQGVVASRDGVSVEAALVTLRQESLRTRLPLRDVCEALLGNVADRSPRGAQR